MAHHQKSRHAESSGYKVHAHGNGERTLCNLTFRQGYHQRHLYLAETPEDITCRNCLEHWYGPMYWPPRDLYPRTRSEQLVEPSAPSDFSTTKPISYWR
jgi:hypothetical protein